MKCLYRVLIKILGTSILLTLAAVLWYRQLSPRQKQFVQNFLQQIPDLPARYQV